MGWSMHDVEKWLPALVVLAIIWAGLWLRARLRRHCRSELAKRRARHAVAAEKHALPLLAAAGYEVEEIQPRRTFSFHVDGALAEVELRADLLVRRGCERLVADVKTGNVAPKISHAPTRRQLLEYRVAYEVDGVLLIDMAEEKIHRVDFI